MVRAHTKAKRLEPPVWPWRSVSTAFVRAGRALVPPVLAVAALVACGDAPPALTVGDITFSDAQLAPIPPSARSTLVATAALTIAASRDEIVERADLLRQRATWEGQADALRREITLAAADVSDAQLSARYETQPAYELDVRHLVILAERTLPAAQRAEAEAKAEAGLQQVQAGEDFATVAGELSEEPGASERGGLLQPGREGTWVDEFWSAAQALAPGQVSPVVESPFGYHVLKLDARRIIPFEEVRDRVAADVAALLPGDAARAFEDSVRASIAVDEAAVEAWTAEGPAEGRAESPADGSSSPTTSPVILASWPGGSLDGAQFRTFAQTGTAGEYRAATGSPDARAAAALDAAVSIALAAEGSSRGLAASPEDVDRTLQDFRLQALGWAAILGLVGPTSPETMATRALDGLSATGQNATVARRELEGRAPLLRAFYPLGGSETAPLTRP